MSQVSKPLTVFRTMHTAHIIQGDKIYLIYNKMIFPND